MSSGYVRANGVNTYVEDFGVGDPVVFLHGGALWGEHYRDTVRHLGRQFRVYAPERRGHGHTADVDGPITYEDMVRDTVGFLDAQDLGRAHLIGHSDGATIAMIVAAEEPERVNRLVLANGNFHVDGLTERALGWIREQMLQDLESALGDSYGRVSPDGREHLSVVLAKMQSLFLTEPTLSVEGLQRIQAPTLIVGGDRDMIALEHFIAEYRAIPNSSLMIVPGGRHMLFGDQAEPINAAIMRFLAS